MTPPEADPLAETRRLASDARWLDALDALEAAGAAAAADEAFAEDVRAHGERFRRARELCGDALDAAAAAEPWEGTHEFMGIETSYRYDAEGLLWLRTAGAMDDVDLFHTVCVLREIQLFGEWIPFLRQSVVVHARDFARLLTHFTIGVRGVLSRDCVLRVAACNAALNGSALYFEGASLPDDQTEWHGAAVPPRGDGWGLDRMKVHALLAKVSFTAKHTQYCRVVVCVDLRTRLPRSILDFFLKRLVGLFLWFWRGQSRYVSAHESCPHRAAIAADPAFYQDWLRPKYEEFCAQQGWDDAALAVKPEDVEADMQAPGEAEPPKSGLFSRLNPFRSG